SGRARRARRAGRGPAGPRRRRRGAACRGGSPAGTRSCALRLDLCPEGRRGQTRYSGNAMLAPLGDVRPAERRGAAAAFLTIFGILAGHTLLETARDALFLARLPPSELPGVYLVMAVVAIALFQGPWRAPRVGGRYGLSLVLVSAGLVTFVFWILHSPRS